MKKILSLLFVLCLVSCSQTRPKNAPVKTAVETPPVAYSETNQPAPIVALPAEATNVVIAPVAETAHTNAIVELPAVTTNAIPSAFGRPPQPAIPALPIAAPTATASRPTNAVPEQMFPAKSIDWRGVPLDSVLQVYGDYVNRTFLRSPAVNGQTPITFTQTTPLTRTEMIQALDAVLALNNIAMIKIGEKFMKVVPVGEANTAGAPVSEQDAANLAELGPYVTHVVQLKYAKPSEMVPILTPFAKVPTAVLPIEGAGIIVLRDYTENVKRMLEMVERVDTAVPAEIESEVIPIKYALAADIANALNTLSGGGGGGTIGSSGGGRSGGTGSFGTSRTTGVTGNTRPGSASTTGGYNRPGSTGFNPQQTGATGLGSPGGLNPGGATAPTGSPDFASRVRSLIGRAAAGGEKEAFQILGQTKIIADERTNSLLVFAGHDDMTRIKDIVSKLDVVLAQVLIEAIIMEVSLDSSKDIGVSSAQQGSAAQGQIPFFGGFNNGQPFGFPLGGGGDSNSFPGNIATTLPANNGLTYWGKFGPNITVAVQAAASHGLVNVLSRPRVQTSHGVEADLFVGQTVPYITGSSFGDFAGVSSRSTYEEKQIGITLKVKPLINPDGLVVMDIYSEIGQRGANVIIDGNPVPVVNQRQASATVAVKDRDTIVLGGMISTTKSKTRSGVPYLKDIPLLGNLFRSTSDAEQRVELIVLLRPTVLPTPEAAAIVATAERKNLPGVRHAENEIRAEEAERLNRADKDLGPNDKW